MWISKKEINGYKQQIAELEEKIDNQQKLKCDLENRLADKDHKVSELDIQIKNLQKLNEDMQKEIEILRKYYKLDEEPSDEIKAKIHIDLEINRLKEEMMKILLRPQIQYLPQPYPYYGMGGFNNWRF